MAVLITVSMALLVCFAIFYQRHLLDRETEQVADHARVISTSLWAYEPLAPTEYLSLAVAANRYEQATVYNEHDQVFLQVKGEAYAWYERVLLSTGLLPRHIIQLPIEFEEQIIGHILVIWPCRALYLILYILFCLVLVFIGVWLFLKLLDGKRFLEQNVRERTAELRSEVQERKKAEEHIRLQAQRLSMHVQHTPLAVIEWTKDFTVSEWNRAAETIFGFTREEVLGKSPFGLILPEREDPHVKRIWQKLITSTGGTRSVNINLTKSTGSKTCDWYNTTLKNSQGEVIGAASLVLDITDRVNAEKANKILQAQLLQSQKMEAIGNLAGGIAHDFNNLLQGISGYTQILLQKFDHESTDYEKLKGIEGACQRATSLIRQLLTLSRKVESNQVALDLNSRITQIRNILKHTIPKMVNISINLDPGLHLINADPIQIEQILLNLAINANQAMPDGGKLVITTSNIIIDETFCETHLEAHPGPHVLLTVTDSGSGMDRETQQRIFEPFFTTKRSGEGTGLGLSTVYGIVKSHNAFISCSSTLGEGTEFKIYFPAILDQPEKRGGVPERDFSPGNNETLLIVDDEKVIRDTGRELLTMCGYNVITAKNGEEAIRIYGERGEEIDLVIMDLNMPGMGGLKSISELKAMNPQALILIASGYIPTESVKRANELGANGFLSKPYNIQDLLNKVQTVLAA